MPREPLVTVLMSVHNDRPFVAEAVRSILAQSFEDFEFFIIDDASRDGSSDVLRAIADPRVRLLTNAANQGLTRSLNIGLRAARGRYVARMDGDDVSEPDRLARQVAFLEASPEVGVLGTGRVLIDERGGVVANAPATCGRLRVLWKMLLGNALAHPTVMLRREVLERHRLRYDESFQTAQDYELWTRLLRHTQADNLDAPLLRYRLRDGISRTRKAEQLANHDRIAHQATRTLLPGCSVSAEDVAQLRGRFGGFSVRDATMDPADERWLAVHRSMLDAFIRQYAREPGIEAFAEEQISRMTSRGNEAAAEAAV